METLDVYDLYQYHDAVHSNYHLFARLIKLFDEILFVMRGLI